MLIGKELEAAKGWFLVDADLHDVSGRVREYDGLARLAFCPETRQLGIARFNERWPGKPGGGYCLARECQDRETGEYLTGEPDARVLWDMRMSDSHFQIRGTFDSWARKYRDRQEAARRRKRAADLDAMMDDAERVAHAANTKDFGWQPMISVPKKVA